MSDFSEMSVEELEQHIYSLTEQGAAIREEKLAAQAALSERQEQAQLAARLNGMSDAEKASLAQALQAEGVQSSEEFGEM